MSFWDFLTHEESKIEVVNEEERARGTRNLNVYLNGIISGTSNDRFSEEEVLSIPVANACLSIVVNSIKDLPVELYERISDKETKKVTNDYRLKLLNDSPNLISTGIDFKAKIIRDIVLHGNAYVEIERNGNNIESLWNLDADKVSIRVLNDTDKPYIVKDVIIDYIGSRVSLGIDDIMIATSDSNDGGLSGNGFIAYGDEQQLTKFVYHANLFPCFLSPMQILFLKGSEYEICIDRHRRRYEGCLRRRCPRLLHG